MKKLKNFWRHSVIPSDVKNKKIKNCVIHLDAKNINTN